MGARSGCRRVGEPDRPLRSGARTSRSRRRCGAAELAATLEGRRRLPRRGRRHARGARGRRCGRLRSRDPRAASPTSKRGANSSRTRRSPTPSSRSRSSPTSAGSPSSSPRPAAGMSDNLGVEPETRYARSGDVSIAYQVIGDGPFDLVYVPPFASHVELAWSIPDTAFFLRRALLVLAADPLRQARPGNVGSRERCLVARDPHG